MAQPIYNDTDFVALNPHVFDITVTVFDAGVFTVHLDGGPYTGSDATITLIRDALLTSINGGTHVGWTAASQSTDAIRITATGPGQHIGGGKGNFNPKVEAPGSGAITITDVTPFEGIDFESLKKTIEADVLILTPLIFRPCIEWIDLVSSPRTLQMNFTVDPLPGGEKTALDALVAAYVNVDTAPLLVQVERTAEQGVGFTHLVGGLAVVTKGAPDFGIEAVSVSAALVAGKRPIVGLQARAHVSDTSEVDIAIGSCADSDGETAGLLTSIRNIDLDLSGAGGLDTGTKANSTWYAVYLIWKDDIVTESTDVAGMFSLVYEPTGPTMPGSFTKRRRIGSVLTGAAGAIIDYRIHGDGNDLTYIWAEDRTAAPFRLVSSGSATSFADVDASGVVPITAHEIKLALDQTGGPSLFIRERDSVGGIDQPEGTVKIRSMASGVAWMGIDSEMKLQYSNSSGGGAAVIDCTGFRIYR